MNASPLSRRPRIIVADDQEWILQILMQVVQESLPLADVVETVDGQEALDAYRSGPCDFLVSNHNMPRMTGPELIRIVRKESPTLPILMVSTHPYVKVEAMEAGANWFLTKEEIMEHLPPILRAFTAGGGGTGPN